MFIHSKEPYIHSKEPHIHSKEPYVHSKNSELHPNKPLKEPYTSQTHTHNCFGCCCRASAYQPKTLKRALITLERALERALYITNSYTQLFWVLYTLKRALYTLKRALYTLKRALYTLKRALYTLQRALAF